MTVVYPFLPPHKISEHVLESLRGAFAAIPGFLTRFSETRRFSGVLYLAPVPDTPFRRLTEGIASIFPEAPPYGGQFADVVPHLTVVHAGDPNQLELIAAEFVAAAAEKLPIIADVRDVMLIEKRTGKWRTQMRFPLGGPGPLVR